VNSPELIKQGTRRARRAPAIRVTRIPRALHDVHLGLDARIGSNMSSSHYIHLPIVELFLYDVRDIHRRFNNLRVDWT
jgi:hypothetical protein